MTEYIKREDAIDAVLDKNRPRTLVTLVMS